MADRCSADKVWEGTEGERIGCGACQRQRTVEDGVYQSLNTQYSERGLQLEWRGERVRVSEKRDAKTIEKTRE